MFIDISLSTFQRGTGFPFCIAFVYADTGNFVVRGNSEEVGDFLEREYKYYFANMTFWKNGKSRNIWTGKKGIVSISRFKAEKRMKYTVYVGDTNYVFRKLPKRWLPEWNQIIEEHKNKVNYPNHIEIEQYYPKATYDRGLKTRIARSSWWAEGNSAQW